MVSHRVAGAPLDFVALRTELAAPGDFASDELAEADAAAAAVELPDEDATDLPLVTIDPPGSRDLDQAMHLAREGDGFVVHYAIADVAAFVRPDGALDRAAWQRGESLYFPDRVVPMLPPVLSAGAASLLPDQLRPALLWRIVLDGAGNPTAVDVRRARVRSRAQLDYTTMQQAADAAALPDAIALLPAVGRARQRLARARHAIDLDIPEQDVVRDGARWRIDLRLPTDLERWNAEISLLTGMAAATLMLEQQYGILRTVPTPAPGAVHALRRAAHALGLPWPDDAEPGDALAAIDRGDPRAVALVEHAMSLLRGSAYTVVDGAPPEVIEHAGIGAPYTHATAPLRRLVDRYVGEICLAHSAGAAVPAWVRTAVPELPATMASADQRAHTIDRAVVDATEAWLLQGRVGETFTALVIDADEHAASVLLDAPPVRARCRGENLPVGQRIDVRLIEADVAQRVVRFESGPHLAVEERDGGAA